MSAAEIYLAHEERGWIAIHESRNGDSSGMEGPFSSITTAVAAGRDMARRYGVPFLYDCPAPADLLPFPVEGERQ